MPIITKETSETKAVQAPNPPVEVAKAPVESKLRRSLTANGLQRQNSVSKIEGGKSKKEVSRRLSGSIGRNRGRVVPPEKIVLHFKTATV